MKSILNEDQQERNAVNIFQFEEDPYVYRVQGEIELVKSEQLYQTSDRFKEQKEKIYKKWGYQGL
jgi:hypothetical protein